MTATGAPPRGKSAKAPGGGRPPRQGQGPNAGRTAGPPSAGLAARQLAVRVIAAVIEQHRPLEEALASASRGENDGLEARDRAFARLIIATAVRRHGELGAVLKTFLAKPLPERRGALWPILLSAAAQLLMLETPPHAAISMAVDQCRADPHAQHFTGLANAVLRRVATEGSAILAVLDAVASNIPPWMLKRWREHYGHDLAHRIAEACLREAPLDISCKSAPEAWAKRLSGLALPTGSIRLAAAGRIEDLAGYAEGAWWVQDAAAALPARLFGAVAGLDVADLCAAPGGKTAELAAGGARVTSVEQSGERAKRLTENLARLSLNAEIVVADAAAWQPGRTFDAVLLDAPCTSTGTIRRHPDILHLKRETDVAQLAEIQARLIANAAGLVKPGGLFVYCTCSLEPEEGEGQISTFLDRSSGFERVPLTAGESGLAAEWISKAGDLRTLPVHLPHADPAFSGMDGFFACRLRRRS